MRLSLMQAIPSLASPHQSMLLYDHLQVQPTRMLEKFLRSDGGEGTGAIEKLYKGPLLVWPR